MGSAHSPSPLPSIRQGQGLNDAKDNMSITRNNVLSYFYPLELIHTQSQYNLGSNDLNGLTLMYCMS